MHLFFIMSIINNYYKIGFRQLRFFFFDSYSWSNFQIFDFTFITISATYISSPTLSCFHFSTSYGKMQFLDFWKMLWRFQCMCHKISEWFQVCKDFGHLSVGFEYLIWVYFSLHIIDLVLGELVESRDSFWKLLNLMISKVHFKERNNHNK